MSIIAAMCVCVSACSSDDPEPEPKPIPDPKENGEVVFDITLPEGNGSGTVDSPAEVQKGETLDMTISQKSSYTDPDGTVFTCEPKAEIVLFAKLDTVVAKDIASLTKVKDGADIKSNTDGTTPVRHQTTQTFEIGGQNIVFDLSHEIYTYVNSMRDKIEMPYIKINQAKLGNTAATEETPQGRSVAVALTGVTVRPLATSRAITITDSTMYEVNALFNLDIESVNAKKDTKQTLVFSVTYIGIVETTTELDGPEGVVSFAWDVKSGTNSTTSPFVRTIGKPLEVWMNQSSRYSDEYGNQAVGEPKAKIKISVQQDTIWTNSRENLEKIANKTGDISQTQAATQVFGNDKQEITIDWSYEVATAELAGKEIPMPYYALEGAVLANVSVKELGYKVYQSKEANLYEVTATFRQKATPQNITGKAVSEEIEYVVSYVGAVEIKLEKVEYFPGGEWVDPHDNMTLGYYAKVIRRRTYSNGAVQEDEFRDFGHPIQWMTNECLPGTTQVGDKSITYYPATVVSAGDSAINVTRSIQFSSKEGGWSSRLYYEKFTSNNALTDNNWNAYTDSKLYNGDELNVAKDVFTPHQPDNRPCGWYFAPFIYTTTYELLWQIDGTSLFAFTDIDSVFNFYDQFLVIDGRRIDFTSLHNLKINHTLNQENFSQVDREGVAVTLKTHISYLGKQFDHSVTDSLYVAK